MCHATLINIVHCPQFVYSRYLNIGSVGVLRPPNAVPDGFRVIGYPSYMAVSKTQAILGGMTEIGTFYQKPKIIKPNKPS